MNNNNNRITYRFNQESKVPVRKTGHNEERPKSEGRDAGTEANSNVIPLYNRTGAGFASSEITPWNSPFQDDATALEELIRNTDREVSGRQTEAGDKRTSADGPRSQPSRKREDERKSLISAPIEWEIPEAHGAKETPPRVPGTGKGRADEERNGENDFLSDADETKGYDEFDWGLELVGRTAKPVYARYNNPSSPSWMKVFLTVAGALATGALFGYLLLSFFTGTPTWPNPAEESPSVQGAAGAKQPSTSDSVPSAPANGQAAEGGAPAPAAAVDMPEQTYYLLQYGVFGSAEGRDAALAELEAKGVAGAALSSAEDYRVYAGMSANRDDAAALKEQFGGGVELYVKELKIGAVKQLPFGGSGEELQRFLEQTNGLVAMLLKLANAQLEQAAPSSFSGNSSQAWRQAAKDWSAAADAVKGGLKDENSQQSFAKLAASVQSAIGQFEGYESNPSRVYLWKAQSSLMDAVFAQKSWFESINAL